jgi:hypothetical protein
VPAAGYEWVICTPSPSCAPSPSKSQRYVSDPPSGSEDPPASNTTVSFLRGLSGDTWKEAIGRTSTCTVWDATDDAAGSAGSSTVSATVCAPPSPNAWVTSWPVALPSPKSHVHVTGATHSAWAVKVAASPRTGRSGLTAKSAGGSARASPAKQPATPIPTMAANVRRRTPCLLILDGPSERVRAPS